MGKKKKRKSNFAAMTRQRSPSGLGIAYQFEAKSPGICAEERKKKIARERETKKTVLSQWEKKNKKRRIKKRKNRGEKNKNVLFQFEAKSPGICAEERKKETKNTVLSQWEKKEKKKRDKETKKQGGK